MKDYAVYLDLDGVLADYDAGGAQFGFNLTPALKAELNRSGSTNPLKRKMYEAVKGTDFYYQLPFLPGALDLYAAVRDADPIILTAAPKFGATEDDYFLNPYWLGAAYHKRRWIEEKLLAFDKWNIIPGVPVAVTRSLIERIPIPDERFICTTSARKHEFMHRKKSAHQILIDDRIANCIAWGEAGGFAILHNPENPKSTIVKLDWYKKAAVEGTITRGYL